MELKSTSREVFHSVHLEIFKLDCIVGVHQVSKFLGCLKLCNHVSLCFFKKGTQLVISLLEVIKTSILLYNINSQFLNMVLQLLNFILGFSRHLNPPLALVLHLLNPGLQ